MNQAKIKDRILRHAYGKPSVAAQSIDGNSDEVQPAIMELHNEGLVQIQHRGTNRGKTSIITYRITDIGTSLVNNGGYVKAKRKALRKNVSKKTISALWAIILLIIGAIIDRIISLLF